MDLQYLKWLKGREDVENCNLALVKVKGTNIMGYNIKKGCKEVMTTTE